MKTRNKTTKIEVPYNRKTARAYELVFDMISRIIKAGKSKTAEVAEKYGDCKTLNTHYENGEYLRTVILDNSYEITIIYNYLNKTVEIRKPPVINRGKEEKKKDHLGLATPQAV